MAEFIKRTSSLFKLIHYFLQTENRIKIYLLFLSRFFLFFFDKIEKKRLYFNYQLKRKLSEQYEKFEESYSNVNWTFR